MKNILRNKIKTVFVAIALQFGIVATAFAGGASILRLPIDGVTEENKDQCSQIFAKNFAPVLINWKNGNVKMRKMDSDYLIELRPERGQITLGQIEKALKGSPFSIDRNRLEYFSLIRFHLGKMENPEKHVKAIALIDGKKMHSHFAKNEDGTVWVTFRDVLRNAAVPVSVSRERSLFTHKRLAKYLSDKKIKLIAVSWGYEFLENSRTYSEAWRGEPFGARLAVASKE